MVNPAVVVAVFVTSCAAETPQPEALPATSVATAASTTSSAPSTTRGAETTESTPSLPVPVIGEAPVGLATTELPVLYPTYEAWLDDVEGPSPPQDLTLELVGCGIAGPGVVIYEVALAGDVTYPFDARLDAVISHGDLANVNIGTITFEQAGRQLVISSLPDQYLPYDEAGELDFRHDRDGSRAERAAYWALPGMSCQVELGSGADFRSNYLDASDDPTALEITAPEATVEALAQASYADGGDAALLPLAVMYGEAIRFYTDRWFIPSDPDRLVLVEEELSVSLSSSSTSPTQSCSNATVRCRPAPRCSKRASPGSPPAPMGSGR